MSELKHKIETLIVEAHRLGDKHPDDYNDIIGDYARRIAALPQQITAETVRRVLVATTAVLQNNQGFGGEMGAEQAQALDEAIAQSANVKVKHEG